jgi:subtilisin family serine protease
VIDSGVDRRHPQLSGRVLAGTDYLDPGDDGTRDCAGHGTGVASVIAAAPRAGVAFRGLAPGARILPVRVSEQQVVDGRESGRTVSAAVFARAIRWAVDQGADVLNLSVVLYADDPAVRAAVAYAAERDVVVVAAAGNLHAEGDPRPYPAAYAGPTSRRSGSTWTWLPRAAAYCWPLRVGVTGGRRGRATPRPSWRPPPRCCASTTPN